MFAASFVLCKICHLFLYARKVIWLGPSMGVSGTWDDNYATPMGVIGSEQVKTDCSSVRGAILIISTNECCNQHVLLCV